MSFAPKPGRYWESRFDLSWLSDQAVEHLRRAFDVPDLSGTRYELVREIGRGGMGVVYLARDTHLGREVALKVLSVAESDGEGAARLAKEARILAGLEHPGIVPIHDLGTLADGRVYYAMKLVQGVRLDQYRASNHSLHDLLRVFTRICEPVAFAHSRGVIHRDLKPANIMVGTFGEVLVLDWGVARLMNGPSDRNVVVGTRGYMAPEQASGGPEEMDARCDVYSLGRTLCFLLELQERVPKRVAAICGMAASAERQLRYASAAELGADIDRFLDGEPVRAYRETPLEKIARLASRNKTLVALVLAYLVTRGLLFFFFRR